MAHTRPLLGVPMGGTYQCGYITPVVWGAMWGEINMATQPLRARGPHSKEASVLIHTACLIGVQINMATHPPTS